jgi:hypothetical protein
MNFKCESLNRHQMEVSSEIQNPAAWPPRETPRCRYLLTWRGTGQLQARSGTQISAGSINNWIDGWLEVALFLLRMTDTVTSQNIDLSFWDSLRIRYIATFHWTNLVIHQSQRPRGLRHELSSLARTLRSWVWIPLEACVYVLCAFILCGSVCM